MEGNRVIAEERLLQDLNSRIRGVNEGPDGSLYVLTDGNDGKILRLVKKADSSDSAWGPPAGGRRSVRLHRPFVTSASLRPASPHDRGREYRRARPDARGVAQVAPGPQ
jgi:hypothetical protein